MNTVRYIALAVMLATFSGCVTYPIDKNIQEHAKPLTLNQVRADPQGTRGTIVIWGGQIVQTVNKANGGAIYIRQFPLRHNAKPDPYGPTMGQFIALSSGFLDPEATPDGSLITVAGVVAGVRTEQMQNNQYPYPVVAIQQTHLWPGEPIDDYPYDYDYYYGPGWYWGPWWWGPWYWGWGYPGYYYYHGGYHGHGWYGGGHGWRGGYGGYHGGGGGGGGFHGH